MTFLSSCSSEGHRNQPMGAWGSEELLAVILESLVVLKLFNIFTISPVVFSILTLLCIFSTCISCRDFDLFYLSMLLQRPVGESKYVFPIHHVCSPRELTHFLHKKHDPSKWVPSLEWHYSNQQLGSQLDIPTAYKSRIPLPCPSHFCTRFPTALELSPQLSQNSCFLHPPTSAPFLLLLQ